MGQGSMTGRGLGFCSGNEPRDFENGFRRQGRGWGRGFGFRRGAGGQGLGRRGLRGWTFWGLNTLGHFIPDRNEEVNMLKSQAESLKNIQKDIERRLGELEKKD